MEFKIAERKVKVRRKRSIFYLDGKEVDVTQLDVLFLKLPKPVPERIAKRISLTKEDLARLECHDRIVEVEEIQSDLQRFRVIIPVIDFGWEGPDVENRSTGGVGLTKRLAKSAGLLHLPQTRDLQAKVGTRATYGIVHRPRDHTNTQQWFFIRKDILDGFLRKNRLKLVWAVWGERQLSREQLERAHRDPSLATYANHQSVYRYEDRIHNR